MNDKDTYLLYRPNITVIHESNDEGSHRITVQERCYRQGSSFTTEWHGYQDIIVVPDDRIPEYRRTSICATTEYWGNKLPRVFRITAGESCE